MVSVLYQSRITRQEVKANPHFIYVFGDNTKRIGFGGQAREIRGEQNGHGIATLWSPGEYFADKDYQMIINIIGRDISSLEYRARSRAGIVFPMDGIGTGLSEMDTRAPHCYNFMVGQLAQVLGITNNMRQYVHAQEMRDVRIEEEKPVPEGS